MQLAMMNQKNNQITIMDNRKMRLGINEKILQDMKNNMYGKLEHLDQQDSKNRATLDAVFRGHSNRNASKLRK